MAYDPGRQVIVMFGGLANAPETVNETWLFEGHCWQQSHPAINPAPRLGAGLAYNPMVALTLLIGGRSQPPVEPDYPQDAWTWDGTTWTRLAGAPKLYFPLASYDEARKVVVVFGWGTANVPETWTWDGKTWARKLSPKSPGVATPAMCFDRSTQKVGLYGGFGHAEGGVSSSTWLWDGKVWTKAQTAHNVGPRINHVLLCGKQTVLFGGLINLQTNVGATDTWVWDGAVTDWNPVTPAHHPPVCCGAAVYDGSRLMMFETGTDGIPVWSWTGSDWTQ